LEGGLVQLDECPLANTKVGGLNLDAAKCVLPLIHTFGALRFKFRKFPSLNLYVYKSVKLDEFIIVQQVATIPDKNSN
jgi:hypothetical protein